MHFNLAALLGQVENDTYFIFGFVSTRNSKHKGWSKILEGGIKTYLIYKKGTRAEFLAELSAVWKKLNYHSAHCRWGEYIDS